jgi:hypothetical protein
MMPSGIAKIDQSELSRPLRLLRQPCVRELACRWDGPAKMPWIRSKHISVCSQRTAAGKEEALQTQSSDITCRSSLFVLDFSWPT